jgi:hypothetical protein
MPKDDIAFLVAYQRRMLVYLSSATAIFSQLCDTLEDLHGTDILTTLSTPINQIYNIYMSFPDRLKPTG